MTPSSGYPTCQRRSLLELLSSKAHQSHQPASKEEQGSRFGNRGQRSHFFETSRASIVSFWRSSHKPLTTEFSIQV